MVSRGPMAAMLLVAGLGSLLPAQAAFSVPSSVPVGLQPLSVAAADLDGDLAIDLVTADSASSSLTRLLNDGTGGFGAGLSFPAMNHPELVAVSDLDGDGIPDLIVGHGLLGSSNLAAFPGSGGGLFGPPTIIVPSVAPGGLVVADLNGDGLRDVAVTQPALGRVVVSLNQGGFVFAPPTAVQVGSLPVGLAAGDFDGDGDVDLAVAVAGSGSVAILLNDGSGFFLAQPAVVLAGGPAALVALDADGDGHSDLAVALQQGNAAVLLHNAGSGTLWSIQGPWPVGASPRAIGTLDLDGDGDADLAVANNLSGSCSVLVNGGSGVFSDSLILTGAPGVRALAARDLDGDTAPDLVAVAAAANALAIYKNRTPRLFLHAPPPLVGTIIPFRVWSPGDALKPYVAAFALGTSPGIVLPDQRRVPLNLDPLFYLSIAPASPFFFGMFGLLDGSGTAFLALAAPPVPALVGLTVFGAFVVADPAASQGIGTLSPALPVTLQ